MPDSMVYFGGSIKALDESGKVGGYLVRFSDGTQKDLSGEYFADDTYLGAHEGDGVDTVFHHGRPIKLAPGVAQKTASEIDALRDHFFAPVKTKRDAVGIWAETVLNMADEYEKAVFGLVKANKLGWSSGAVGHLVKTEADGKITRWPIGEASITPTPCEPLNRALTIKSLDAVKYEPIESEAIPAATDKPKTKTLAAKLNQHIDDLVDDKGRTRESIISKMAREAGMDTKAVEAILADTEPRPTDAKLKAFARVLDVNVESLKASARNDYAQTIKGMFEEALAEETPSRWELESVYCKIIKRLANAAAAAQMAGVKFDLAAKIQEATTEYTALLQAHALAQIESWMQDGADDDFYLKSVVDTAESVKALAASDLDTHSQLTVSVLREIATRFRGNHEGRIKAGRVLSEKNRQRIGGLLEQMKAVEDDLRKLLDESMPMASSSEKMQALTQHLRTQWRARLLGVQANG